MAFLIKLHEIRKRMDELERLVSEATALHKEEGIGDKEIVGVLNDIADHAAPDLKKIGEWLEDKQSQIEELEFLSTGFRLEYGAVIEYRNFAARVQNPDLKKRLAEFGAEEALHADELAKLIKEKGGQLDYRIVPNKQKKELDLNYILDDFIEKEKKTIAFYQKGEEKFQSAEFCWLLGKIKMEEKDHLKDLEALKAEFENKEILVTMEPDFKWVDPLMGEPGDRAWTE